MHGASRVSLGEVRERLDELLAGRDGAALDAVSDALFAVVRLLGREAALRRSLSDPSVPGGAKRELARSLFAERLDDAALQVVEEVAERRWSTTADFLDAIELLGVQAAFARAEAEQSLDDIEDELFRFSRIVEREPDLRMAFADPQLPTQQKEALVHALLDGRAHEATVRLVVQVVASPRGRTADRAVEQLAQQAAERRQRLIAAVRVAVPLTDEQTDRLRETLREAYGRPVRLQVELDRRVVGGLVVRVGDEVIDASVARRLADIRRQFTR